MKDKDQIKDDITNKHLNYMSAEEFEIERDNLE